VRVGIRVSPIRAGYSPCRLLEPHPEPVASQCPAVIRDPAHGEAAAEIEQFHQVAGRPPPVECLSLLSGKVRRHHLDSDL
jgi:hypothetical protein